MEGQEIGLSDGRKLTISKKQANWPDLHVIMKNPEGSKVTISYDDGKDTYSTKMPFDYTVKKLKK